MASAAPEIPVLARDQAFETLYRRYVKDVYHYALALLRNPADAEDVTQTTFLNAYRAFRRGDEILKPQNWLIKITHNVARTRYARARRVKEVPLEDHLEHLAIPDEEKPDVESVLRALGRLPFNQRAAIVMRELEGRSYAEIADTLGVSVSAVETLIFRARRSLRLRASALRSLAAVPVPSSLTKLFEGGGLLAGGGAVIGSGFAVKATVALVAGVLATGIGGDRGRPGSAAVAASTPAAPFAIAPPWEGRAALADRSAPGTFAIQGTLRGAERVTSVVDAVGRLQDGGAAAAGTTHSGAGSPLGETPVAPSTGGLLPAVTTTAEEVTAPVTQVVTTVTEVASDPTGLLPVEVPTLPPPTVNLPSVPPPPSLP
jgi:RNA polymerase sigma factor (sigma-70 family)